MLKLFRYLKNSIPSVILVILLLVVQAVSDLSLPEYTSNIVNIGIQQGGIDTTAPEVIRQSEMQKLLLFLSPEDQETVKMCIRDRARLCLGLFGGSNRRNRFRFYRRNRFSRSLSSFSVHNPAKKVKNKGQQNQHGKNNDQTDQYGLPGVCHAFPNRHTVPGVCGG